EGGYDIAAEAPARTPLILDRIASG
ncbi:MAG: hypothetical protein JWR06_804, partial [Jatrophihabitans sp.]|nr:hypothetical protein [Jatrophihabitans sp.]